MSSYFPLPPNIEIGFDGKKILGSLTFLNFPNNIQKINLPKVSNKEIYIGIYIIRNKLWELLCVQKCFYKEFVEINRRTLSISDSEMAVAVIRRTNDFLSLIHI